MDPQVELLQLEHRDIDISGDGIPPNSAGLVLASPTLRPLAQPKASPGNLYLTMYPSALPAFRDRTVRQAMNWAINKEALGKITPRITPGTGGWRHGELASPAEKKVRSAATGASSPAAARGSRIAACRSDRR